MRLSTTMKTTMSPPRWPFVPSDQQPERGEQTGGLEPPAEGLREGGEEGPPPHWRPCAVLWGVHTSSPSGLFRVLWEEQRVQP